MNSQKPGTQNSTESGKRSQQRRRSKSLMLIFVIIITGITVLCLAVMGIMQYYANQETETPGNTILFYEPDYSLNILENKEYLGLDRKIMFENSDTGIAIELVDGDLFDVPTTYHSSVGLLLDFINYAINGKTDELNALFSEEYVSAGGKLKMDFTMQQIYNIKITYVKSLTTEEDGNIYQSHDYWLEYMIHKNNGTFRSDMGSDCIRKEYVRVTDRNGRLGIDVLAPYVTQEIAPQQSLTGGKIAILAVVSISIITLFGGVCWIISKPTRRKK